MYMAKPAAKEGDEISGESEVWVQGSQSPVVASFYYAGLINKYCSFDVFIMGKPAATLGSTATTPPVPPLASVLSNANYIATIAKGSTTVFINSKSAARDGDEAEECDYSTTPSPGECDKKQNGKVKAEGSVYVGD